MTLSIGGINISEYAIPPTIEESVRTESVSYALDGTVLIDRVGAMKMRIQLTIGLIDSVRWSALKDVLERVSFDVQASGEINFTKQFHLSGSLPSPLVYADGTKYYCSDIALTLEEI